MHCKPFSLTACASDKVACLERLTNSAWFLDETCVECVSISFTATVKVLTHWIRCK